VVTRTRWDVTPSRFRWLAIADLVALILIVLSGAAVRLTGSGLGCLTWPTCVANQITTPLHYHAVIEYGNRILIVVLTIITGASCLGAYLRTPRRRDLVVLTGALVAGIIADAGLGSLVVYTKLNPWLVSLHMLISLVLVATAALTVHRAGHRYDLDAPVHVYDERQRLIARWLWVPFVAVILSGTVTTGAGPHSGNSQGSLVVRRLPIAFNDAALIHLTVASIFVAIVVALLVSTARWPTAAAITTGVRRLAAATVLQAAVGVTQYELHVPVALVELHIFGAVALTIGVVQLNLRQVARAREPDVPVPSFGHRHDPELSFAAPPD
jgi:heme a synthase